MSLTLQNKRALVTGGSRGIGAAIVKRLAREGADVALTYVSKPDRANGMVTYHNACNGVQPSIRAASSSSRGIVSKNVLIIQMLNGRPPAV